MPEKSSRFQRVAYARQASRLADELLDWSKIYSRRSYAIAHSTAEVVQKERDAERADVLEELVVELQRISIRILALQ